MNERIRELFDAVVQDPSNLAVVDELDALLRSEGEWAPLVDLQIHLAQNSADPADAVRRLKMAGQIAESMLNDARRAVEIYGASVEADPEARGTLEHMRTLLAGLEDWATWVQVGEAEVERIEAVDERAALIYALGEVLEEKLVGVIDLVVEEEGRRVLVEHKTSSKKYTLDQLTFDTQLSGYAFAAESLGWGTVGLRYSISTKTKVPQLQVEDVRRDDRDQADFLATALGVLTALDAGISFPIRGWACKGCPYRSRCESER